MLRERNKDKRPLSVDDIAFLTELQHELNTQEIFSQADPRFWVIKGEKEICVEKGCGDFDRLVELESAERVAEDIHEAARWLLNHEVSWYNERNENKVTIIRNPEKNFRYTVIKTYGESDDDIEEEEVDNIEELLDVLDDMDVITEKDYELCSFKLVPHIYPDTMFLTYRECKRHCNENHYHYDKEAHPYVMTAWRSPEVTRLWQILQQVDWIALKEKGYANTITNGNTTE